MIIGTILFLILVVLIISNFGKILEFVWGVFVLLVIVGIGYAVHEYYVMYRVQFLRTIIIGSVILFLIYKVLKSSGYIPELKEKWNIFISGLRENLKELIKDPEEYKKDLENKKDENNFRGE